MRKSSTNVGILNLFEKIIRSHPLIYIFCRSLIRYSNIFEKDFDGLKLLDFKKKINIIDVGASDGISAKFFNNNLNVNKIICFEPYKKYYKILKSSYNLKNLLVKPYAIGNKPEIKKIFYPRYDLFGKKFDIITYTHYDKNLLKHHMKDFIFRKNLGIVSDKIKIKKIKNFSLKIDLIKIDTNGYEFNIIKGLTNVIKKYRPVLILEINKDKRKIIKLLNKFNYQFFYYSSKQNKFVKKFQSHTSNLFFLQKKNKF